MKQFLFLLISTALSFSVYAQLKDPVSFTYAAKKKSEGNYDIVLTASIQKPWHIYSQNTGKGPIPTQFTFKPNPLITVEGKVKEVGKLEKVYDPNFKSEVLFYSNSVQFVQPIKLKAKAKTAIVATITYMVCNDEQCLPPTKKTFSITVQ